LQGDSQAQFQGGSAYPTGFSMIGAPNIIYALNPYVGNYSVGVRFWLNTQNNIVGGTYYPNGAPTPAPTPAATPVPVTSTASVPVTAASPTSTTTSASGTSAQGQTTTTAASSGSQPAGGKPTVASSPPINPNTGKEAKSNIDPAKPLNINAYNGSGLIDHVANNQLTSNSDFNKVITAISQLPTAAQTEQALDQILAEPYASVLTVTLEAINNFRQSCIRGSGGGKNMNLSGDGRWTAFTDIGNTQAAMTGTTDGLANFDYNIFQSIVGVEYAVTKDFTTGVVMGYGFDQLSNFQYTDTKLHANSVHVALIEKYNPGNFRFTGLMGYSDFQYTSTRQINFGSPSSGYINRTASGRWQSDGLVAAISAGYEQKLGPVVITPSILFSYVYQLQQSINETGAGSLNLHVDPAAASSMILAPGLQIEAPIRLNKNLVLTPKAYASWEHDFLAGEEKNHEVNASFSSVSEPGSLTVFGVNRGQNAVNVEAGLELTVNERWAIYAGATYQYWGVDQELGYNGGLRYRW